LKRREKLGLRRGGSLLRTWSVALMSGSTRMKFSGTDIKIDITQASVLKLLVTCSMT
jgi:hypothetical protein